MMRRYLWLAACLLIAACSTSGKPLPLVDKGDPTWALTPDKLEMGMLPK